MTKPKAVRAEDEAVDLFPPQLYVMREQETARDALYFVGKDDLRELEAKDGDLVAVYVRADVQVMNIRRTLEPRGRRVPSPVMKPPVKRTSSWMNKR